MFGHPEADGTISAPNKTAHEAMIYTEADSSNAENSQSLSQENEVLTKSDKGWMTSKDFRQEFDTGLFGSVQGRSREQKSLSDEKQEEDEDSDEEEATPRTRQPQLASPSDDAYIRKIELLGESERRQVFDSMEVKEKLIDPNKVEKLEASVEFDQNKISEERNPSDDADVEVLCSSAIAEALLDSASTARKVPREGPQSTSMLRLNEASKKNKSREKETANVKSIACSSEEKIQVHDTDRSTSFEENMKRTSIRSCSPASISTRQGSDVGNVMNKLGSSFQGQSKADSSKTIGTSMVCDDETTEAVPFDRQNQELNTTSLGSFASISTLKSLVSGFFNSVGLGRQPTFPSRAPEDENSTGIIKRQTYSMSRQFSTSNAIPSENYDDDERVLGSVEEVSATDGGKEMCEGATADDNEMNEGPADRVGKCQPISKYQVSQKKATNLKILMATVSYSLSNYYFYRNLH